MKKQGTLFLIVGPSQVGKDAIIKRLLHMPSLKLRKVVTATTRAPRPGEIHGRNYYFISNQEFDKRIKRGEFFEWAYVQTHRSGTPREPLTTWLKTGHAVIQHIDVKGADVIQKIPSLNTVSIFVLPGTVSELRQRFNRRRFVPREARVRWRTTLAELAQQIKYDYRVVNAEGQLSTTVREVAEIIKATSNAGLPS